MIFERYDRIVFAGDSVTDMGSQQPVGEGLFENVGRSYVRVLENMFASYYPEVFLRITNAGISGNTSRDLLERFDQDVVSLNPDWVSICIGINDVWRQFDSPAILDSHVLPKEYESNLTKMIEKVKDNVKGIFILSPYMIEPLREDKMRARMDEYVEICRKLSNEYGCIFVDFQKMYEDYCQIRHSAYIAWDRIHPNQIGATLMAKEFLKHCDFDYHHEK
ncbi:MAG: SGNH/GDSL hydrolase family protein [Clostridia bacterium]|nr:SGNH/GDSL hydrolase family protein [Clostridia bacterium]